MIETDALVIGAGPVGLFQVFQLGLLGLKAEIIDVQPEAGGQCAALYPDKPIYDIPGVPLCTGRELTRQLLAQAAPFMPVDASASASSPSAPSSKLPRNLHLGQLVAELRTLADGAGFEVVTDQAQVFRCKAVFVAAGAGAFVPKTLGLPGIDAAGNVHHHVPWFGHDLDAAGDAAGDAPSDAPVGIAGDTAVPPWAGKHLVVYGGGDEALATVIALGEQTGEQTGAHTSHGKHPARLTLLHRRDQFQADAALDAQVRGLIAAGRVELAVGLPQAAVMAAADTSDHAAHAPHITNKLQALTLLGADGQTRELPLDHLLIRLGMSPKLGPLAQWGLNLDRKQVPVSTASFQSDQPRIYAVGDINTYPGKKRLLLCGFHEATLAAHHAAAELNPDAPQHLLYTTTSSLLHERLGVSPAGSGVRQDPKH